MNLDGSSGLDCGVDDGDGDGNDDRLRVVEGIAEEDIVKEVK